MRWGFTPALLVKRNLRPREVFLASLKSHCRTVGRQQGKRQFLKPHHLPILLSTALWGAVPSVLTSPPLPLPWPWWTPDAPPKGAPCPVPSPGPRPGKPMTAGTGSQDWSGEHSASPQDLRTDLGVRGSGVPLGIYSVAFRANKASVMTRISLLDGWGLRAGTPGSVWGGSGCGVVWQGWGIPDGNILHEAFFCWGLAQGVSQEGRGSKEWEKERWDATQRDTRQGVRLAWPKGLVLQPQTL